MSHAPPRLTAQLLGSTIDNTQWRWIREIERYTMPNCVFCQQCYESKNCDHFNEAFKSATPSVVCASMLDSGYLSIMASEAALADERSIRLSDNDILEALCIQRSSAGGKLEGLFSDVRRMAERFFADKTRLPPSIVHRAGDQFLNGFKAGVARESAAFAPGWFDGAQPTSASSAETHGLTIDQVLAKWMLSRDATTEQIQQRFAKLASIAHPDHGGSNEAMAQLLAERDLLLNPR